MVLGGGPSKGSGNPAASYVLQGREGGIFLFWAASDPKRTGLRNLGTQQQALELLRGTKDLRATVLELRRMLRATWIRAVGAVQPAAKQRLWTLVFGPGDLLGAEGDELLVLVAQLIAADRLRVDRIVTQGGGRSRPTKPEPEPATAPMATAPRTKLTWVAIQLLDWDDQPVPGEEYELTLPDGAVRKGALDGDGRARERGVDPGTCKVKFPKIDKDAWEFVRSESE